jgi:predicted O-methyltransferase YrrM
MMEKAAKLSNAFGFLYPAEVEALVGVAEQIPENGTMINIGAGVGTSSLAVAEARPDINIITVDICEGGPLGGLENEINAFKNAEMEDQLPEQILGDSKEIGKTWDRDKVDFIFVDGDHTEPGIRNDIDAWLQHVKDGGIIVFHDYNIDVWPKVTSVVDELMSGYKSILKIDTLKAFRV